MANRRSQSRMSALEAQNLIAALMYEDHPDSNLELWVKFDYSILQCVKSTKMQKIVNFCQNADRDVYKLILNKNECYLLA